jgi:hypothetical protein
MTCVAPLLYERESVRGVAVSAATWRLEAPVKLTVTNDGSWMQ